MAVVLLGNKWHTTLWLGVFCWCVSTLYGAPQISQAELSRNGQLFSLRGALELLDRLQKEEEENSLRTGDPVQISPEENFINTDLDYELARSLNQRTRTPYAQFQDHSIQLPFLQSSQKNPGYINKRASYMSVCHFKICNMGRKRRSLNQLGRRNE